MYIEKELGRVRMTTSNNKMINILFFIIFINKKRRWDDTENDVKCLVLFERSRNLIQLKQGL